MLSMREYPGKRQQHNTLEEVKEMWRTMTVSRKERRKMIMTVSRKERRKMMPMSMRV